MTTIRTIVRGLILVLGASQLCTLAMAGAETLPTPAGPEEMTLVEIVVTAQKRSENMQDVPIAITSITADRLESGGISDARDLTLLVPALDVTAFSRQSVRSVDMTDGECVLRNDGSLVEILRHVVCRGADHLDSVFEGLRIRFGPFEAGQERVMNIDASPGQVDA